MIAPSTAAALEDTAAAMVAAGKGILAADESSGTIAKRFAAVDLESSADNRRDYRHMLFASDDAMREAIAGVILFDETLRQRDADGKPMIEHIMRNAALPGVKVDAGLKPMPGSERETVTEGLDGLEERLRDYVALGARFAKWRAVFRIAEGLPTRAAIHVNAHGLARYAAHCQSAGLVPIVEPETLMDGDHDIERCAEVTEAVLHAVYRELALQGVHLEGTLLKPNMVASGSQAAARAGFEAVAERTIRVLSRTVPAAVGGIAFLSGGQADIEATGNLNAMNAMKAQGSRAPWALSFSFGRALQASALRAWGGRSSQIAAGRAAFTHRARMNGLAVRGRWNPDLENEPDVRN